jgi:hypothetical protein
VWLKPKTGDRQVSRSLYPPPRVALWAGCVREKADMYQFPQTVVLQVLEGHSWVVGLPGLVDSCLIGFFESLAILPPNSQSYFCCICWPTNGGFCVCSDAGLLLNPTVSSAPSVPVLTLG